MLLIPEDTAVGCSEKVRREWASGYRGQPVLGEGQRQPRGTVGRTATEPVCFPFSSTGLIWEKPAHSGTFPSHSAVYKKPCSLPLLVTSKGSRGKEARAGCGWNGQGWLWRPVCAISPQRARSCRGGTVTVAANRRGSGSVEGLSDALPDIQEPFPLLHQRKAVDTTAGLQAWKTGGPRSKADYRWWPTLNC